MKLTRKLSQCASHLCASQDRLALCEAVPLSCTLRLRVLVVLEEIIAVNMDALLAILRIPELITLGHTQLACSLQASHCICLGSLLLDNQLGIFLTLHRSVFHC